MGKNLIMGGMVILNKDNIDTDQIIPKEFLTGLTKSGLGGHLFSHWRKNRDSYASFLSNNKNGQKAKFMYVGAKFGCGSSREHAVWALQDFGFRVIFGKSFADIFYSNSWQCGLVLVIINEAQRIKLFEVTSNNYCDGMSVNLSDQTVSYNKEILFNFELSSQHKRILSNGEVSLDNLLSEIKLVTYFEGNRKKYQSWI